jgi:RNA polymerase sigma factor (sigma-70 family)
MIISKSALQAPGPNEMTVMFSNPELSMSERTSGVPMQERETSSFEAVYAARRKQLARYATMLVGDAQLGDDLAQEAFIRCFTKRRPLEDPWPYLRAIVTNLAKDQYRHNSVVRRKAGLLRPLADVLPPGEDRMVLLTAIYALPIRQRAAVVLKFYEDCSEQEIALVIGCRPGTVKSLLSRALTTLRTEVPR